MEKLSLIADFRKLEENIGKEPSDLILRILDQREEMVQENLATKDDLSIFATKDDLKLFATKDDLKLFATREDLRIFATREDLIQLEAKMLEKIGNMAWKMAGLLILQAGVIVALIKLIQTVPAGHSQSSTINSLILRTLGRIASAQSLVKRPIGYNLSSVLSAVSSVVSAVKFTPKIRRCVQSKLSLHTSGWGS